MAVYGNVGVFDETLESFDDYRDRVEAFMKANKIAEAEKPNLFLSLIGPKTYKLLKDILSPAKPSEKNYAEIAKALSDHYKPRPLVIAERFKFWTAHQGDHETVSQYIVRLKGLSSSCEFTDFLQDALRDRLVSGLNRKFSKTQTHLLSLRDLTFVQSTLLMKWLVSEF